MTLLYVDGFEHQSTAGRYSALSANLSFPAGRFSGKSITGNSGQTRVSFTASAEVYVGMAVYPRGAETVFQVRGDGGTTEHLRVSRAADGTAELRRGGFAGTLVASSAVGVLPLNVWSYVELRATVADVGGRGVVRVNGSTVIDFTGDTRDGGTSTDLDALVFNYGTSTISAYVDDMYVCNALGVAPHNTFLGDVTVHTLTPTGNGASSGLTGSDGDSVDNYLHVDEQPVSDTDYAGSSTVGAKDTYALSDLPGTVASVLGVQHSWYAHKSDSGALAARSVVRSGAVDYLGSTVALPTSTAFQQDLRPLDPATSAAWTVANVNALQTGMEVV